MRAAIFLLVLFGGAALAPADSDPAARGPEELEKPVRLSSGGVPIDVENGHAAPFVCDWDGDGRQDLLVGRFRGGRLRIYPNTGAEERPVLGAPEPFLAGGAEGSVPEG